MIKMLGLVPMGAINNISRKSVDVEKFIKKFNEEKKEISVTELKDKVLEILNYPREFSKKQNLLIFFECTIKYTNKTNCAPVAVKNRIEN